MPSTPRSERRGNDGICGHPAHRDVTGFGGKLMRSLAWLPSTLRSDLDRRTIRGQLVGQAIESIGIKAGAMLLAFGASMVYARALGPGQYGHLSFLVALTGLATMLVGMGIPALGVRVVAAEGSGSLAATFLSWGNRRIARAGLVVATVACLVALALPGNPLAVLAAIGAAIPLLGALNSARQAVLRGFGMTTSGQWPQMLLSPVLTLAGAAGLWITFGELSAWMVVVATTMASICTFFVLGRLLSRVAEPRQGIHEAPWSLADAIPFLWLAAGWHLNSRLDLLLMGTLSTPEQTGGYAVDVRLIDAIAYLLIAANTVLGPRIAALDARQERGAMQRLLTASSRRIFLVGALLALAFIGWGDRILELAFGSAYTGAWPALAILATGQLVNLAMGSTGLLLNMSGHERTTARVLTLATLINMALNLALIPRLGMVGAAIATATATVTWNLILWIVVRRRLGYRADIMG